MSNAEKIIDASEPVAWERYKVAVQTSYGAGYVFKGKAARKVFLAGFRAGIEFARIALEQGDDQTTTDGEDGSAER